MSVKVVNRSVVVRRRVRGFRKGSGKGSGVLREGVVEVGVRGSWGGGYKSVGPR